MTIELEKQAPKAEKVAAKIMDLQVITPSHEQHPYI